MLRPTRAGLLRIGWELSCPGCGLIIDSVERFGDLDNQFHCEICARSQDIALADWIHVTFTVRPEVRRTRFHDPGSLSLRDRVLHCEVGAGTTMFFADPAAAARAAIGMHRGKRNCGYPPQDRHPLRHGIGVTYRGGLDWFGSTVNLAARAQPLAGAADVCVTATAFERCGDAFVELDAEPIEARVRGIDEPIRVRRITVS